MSSSNNVYVRKTDQSPIHIKLSGKESTRCAPGRYDTTEWQHLSLEEIDAQFLCVNCMSRPEDASYYEVRRNLNKSRAPYNVNLKRKL